MKDTPPPPPLGEEEEETEDHQRPTSTVPDRALATAAASDTPMEVDEDEDDNKEAAASEADASAAVLNDGGVSGGSGKPSRPRISVKDLGQRSEDEAANTNIDDTETGRVFPGKQNFIFKSSFPSLTDALTHRFNYPCFRYDASLY